MTATCGYCEKTFVRESSIERHMCEKKRRFLALNEPASRIAFAAFCTFWQLHQRNGSAQTHDTFIKSSYYTAFKRYGNYCVSARVLNSDSFVRWLLRNNVVIDQWTRDTHYTAWLIEYLRTESITDALARSIEYSIAWASTTGMQPQDILRTATTSRLTHAVSRGSLSPWAIYGSSSGQRWLANLAGNDLLLIYDYIDTARWGEILAARADDYEYARQTLLEAGW